MAEIIKHTTAARYWRHEPPDRIRCYLCPRLCRMKDGQRGACFVRKNVGGQLVLTSYGRISGLCVDPIDKKPLYHFLPGTDILSFGSMGCHLACRFCQNWHLSAATDERLLGTTATPEQIAATAVRTGCSSVAFTYNDPIPSLEFVVDVAAACHERGLRTVAVTNGYISEEACAEFFGAMDAANVDLKSFSEAYYWRNCAAHLEPVLKTLEFIARQGRTWLEVTTLLIPGENDSDEELNALSNWVVEHLGPEVPLHFSAFRPAYKMMDRPPTPPDTLFRARRIAMAAGLRYVYTGNIADPVGSATYCANCTERVIERHGFTSRPVGLTAEGRCRWCGEPIAGVWG